MKKILSLLLVVAMLLSVAPMTWAAEQDAGTTVQPNHARSLVLSDGIGVNYKVSKAWIDANSIDKVTFELNGEEVQTYENTIPAMDGDKAVFPFTALTPADMDKAITIKYFAGETLVEEKANDSVLKYCLTKFSKADETALMKTALYDMLKYGVATAKDADQQISAELETALQTYAGYATTTAPNPVDKTAFEGEAGAVVWKSAGLNLKDSVTLRVKFQAESVENLVLVMTCRGNSWAVRNFHPIENEDGCYYAYFSALDPAQMRELIYGQFYDRSGNAVSNKLIYSVESYAAKVNANADRSQEEKDLANALITYGDSVKTWAYTIQAGDDLTYIEAEDVLLYTGVDTSFGKDAKKPVEVAENAAASGGKVAQWTWTYSAVLGNYTVEGSTDLEAYPAHVGFNVKAQTTDTYFVWAKVSLNYKEEGNTAYPNIWSYIEGSTRDARDNDISAKNGYLFDVLSTPKYFCESENEFIWVLVGVCNWTEDETYGVNFRARNGERIIFDQFLVTADHTYSPAVGDTIPTFNYDTVIEAENTALDASRAKITESETVKYATIHTVFRDDNFTRHQVAPGAPGAINFKVKTGEPGTYYLWFNMTSKDSFYISFNNGEYKGCWPTSTGWTYGKNAGNSFTTTTAGEIIEVSIIGRQGNNVFDQFYVSEDKVSTPHAHTFEETWTTDESYHWHAATCACTDRVGDKATHDYTDDLDESCNTCGYIREIHVHTFEESWTKNDTHHWHKATCDCADLTSGYAEHDFGTSGKCVCGKVDFYIAGSNPVYIEAEDADLFTETDPLMGKVVVSVNDGYIEVGQKNLNTGNGAQGSNDLTSYPAHVSFDVKASAKGTYYIYALVKNTNTPAVPTELIYADGAQEKWTYANFVTAGHVDFTWVQIATCTWEEGGTYTVRLRARQQPFAIDKFFVTSDKNLKPHVHVYDTESWTSDATHHWHACKTAGCTEVIDKAEHEIDENGVCVCGKVSYYIATDSGAVYIEAEDANLFAGYDATYSSTKYPVTVLEDAVASGGKGVQLGDGTSGRGAEGSNTAAHPAHISFNVKATTTKTYRLFVKVKEGNTLGSNIYWSINKEGTTDMSWAYFGTNQDATTDYHWYSVAIDMVEGETYTIGFRPRDQYVVIDQFCVSFNSYTPT